MPTLSFLLHILLIGHNCGFKTLSPTYKYGVLYCMCYLILHTAIGLTYSKIRQFISSHFKFHLSSNSCKGKDPEHDMVSSTILLCGYHYLLSPHSCSNQHLLPPYIVTLTREVHKHLLATTSTNPPHPLHYKPKHNAHTHATVH